MKKGCWSFSRYWCWDGRIFWSSRRSC